MQQMADKLGEAAELAKNGDPQQAADKLDELAQDMKDMQKDLDNLQMVRRDDERSRPGQERPLREV